MSSLAPPGATLGTCLSRCRRRSMAVHMVRHTCTATVAALLGAEMLSLLQPGRLSVVTATAALWAVALLCAAVHTFARRPGVRQIAAALDSRLRLQDRLVTAVQFEKHADVFSRLVVRDALGSLAQAHSAALFPFEIPRLAWWLALAAAAVPIMTAIATVVGPRVQQPATGASTRFISRGAAVTGASSGRPAEHRQVGDAPNDATSVRATPDQDRRPDPAAQSGHNSKPASTTSAAFANRPLEDPLREVQPSGGSQSRQRSPDSGPAQAGGHASAGGGGGSPTASGQAGGVNGGSLLAGASTVPERSTFAATARTAAYRIAWLKTQSAISQDRVPADRRAYVKRYFTAIRPPEHE
jgi:uncharacterized membrane protein YgcG